MNFLKEDKNITSSTKSTLVASNSSQATKPLLTKSVSKENTNKQQQELTFSTTATTTNNSSFNNSNNMTVESLLLNLEKIEKESESLLHFEKSKNSNFNHQHGKFLNFY